MIRRTFLAAILVANAFAQQKDKPMTPVTDIEDLPRVLLIGDSISIGYTVDVRAMLKGKANVHRPLTNCGPTTNGIKNLDAWLETGGKGKKWDVIHFNWGLHDLKYMGPNGKNLADPAAETSKPQVSQADYEKNLRELVKRLKKTEARLIWRNTTPVPEGAKGRVVGDSKVYNDIAAKVMKEENIEIHDLYSFAKEHAAIIQRKADVHYTPAGSKQLAAEVVKALDIGK
ncbi:SGNH/GDSL hydrolase family protein [Verrucomicrobiaceae bacterium 227]